MLIMQYKVQMIFLNQGKDLDNFLWEMIKYVKDILVFQKHKKLDLYNQNELEQVKRYQLKLIK